MLRDFLCNRKQRVDLNSQYSYWADFRVGVPQGTFFGTFLFLIYINDLSDGFKSECKLFAVDTSLFFVADDINTSANNLSEDS